ncbi:MAG: hypothetical protein RIF41_21595 [Polyangiaceae bacterium]
MPVMTRLVLSCAMGAAMLWPASASAQDGDWPEVPPPPPPPPKIERAYDLFDGTNGFLGMGVKPGMGIAIQHGGGTDTGFALLWAVRGGLLIDRTELSLEVAPLTAGAYWPGDKPNLSALFNFGYHLPLGGPVNWPFRVGAGLTAVNFIGDKAAFQSRLDAVGISINYRHFLVDIQVPSLRHHTDFDQFSLLNLYFGIDAAYVF